MTGPKSNRRISALLSYAPPPVGTRMGPNMAAEVKLRHAELLEAG
jgi:hypothetical protein